MSHTDPVDGRFLPSKAETNYPKKTQGRHRDGVFSFFKSYTVQFQVSPILHR